MNLIYLHDLLNGLWHLHINDLLNLAVDDLLLNLDALHLHDLLNHLLHRDNSLRTANSELS